MSYEENVPEIVNCIGEYNLVEIIGRGTFSVVYKAIDLKTNSYIAIKKLEKGQSGEMFQKEVAVCKMLDHPLIAQIFDTCEDDNYFYIVMEYVPGDTLLEYINNIGKLDESDIRYFAIQFISIFDYLHNYVHVLHRDIKAENLIVGKNNILHLIDFGFSKPFTEESPNMTTLCGSINYAAPEIVSGESYSTPSDVWSLGVILYAMSEGHLPFYARSTVELIQQIQNQPPIFRNVVSKDLQDLINSMLDKDQEKRITIDQMKFHHWFAKTNIPVKLAYWKNSSMKTMVRESIDNGVLDQMQDLGIPIDCILDDLIAKRINTKTTTYRILKKNKINEKIDSESGCHCNPRNVIAPILSSRTIQMSYLSPLRNELNSALCTSRLNRRKYRVTSLDLSQFKSNRASIGGAAKETEPVIKVGNGKRISIPRLTFSDM